LSKKPSFIKELSRATTPRKVEIKRFEYKKPVVSPEKTDAMGTIHRAKEFKTVRKDEKNSTVKEMRKYKSLKSSALPEYNGDED
jgi:hypothetical protein